MLIELKNGDTYNGRLVSCNIFMNIYLRDVICTSKVRVKSIESGIDLLFLNVGVDINRLSGR
jgi:small nuclear ribonucleoprotein (snRNP)-like protein